MFKQYALLLDTAMRTPNNYLMLTLGRCGSTMLGSALDGHSEIRWFGELFDVGGQNKSHWHYTIGQRLKAMWGRPGGGFSLIPDELPPRSLPERPQLMNVDVPFIHSSETFRRADLDASLRAFIWPVIWELYEAEALKIILLGRRNLVARYVSYRHAWKTGVWHADSRQAAKKYAAEKPMYINADACAADVRRCERLWDELTTCFPDALWLYYEDLQENRDEMFDRVQDFLWVEREALRPETHKLPTPWKDRVSNYGGLSAYFHDHPTQAQFFKEES